MYPIICLSLELKTTRQKLVRHRLAASNLASVGLLFVVMRTAQSKTSNTSKASKAAGQKRPPSESLQDLPNRRVWGRASKGGEGMNAEHKDCAFLCGVSNHDQDEVSPEDVMRWSYPNGSGANCWYCERIWCVQLSHIWPKGRKSYQEKVNADKNFQDEHIKKRTKFVEDRKSGTYKQLSSREYGIKNVKVKSKQRRTISLDAPEDYFWKIEDYVKKFGCLSEAKKRKHKVTKYHGIRGVLVPGSETGQPFKLRRSIKDEIEKEEEHDIGSDGEFGIEVAEAKFADLNADADEAYENACVGMVADVLAQCAMEDVEDTPTKAKKGATNAKSSPLVPSGRGGFESDDEVEPRAGKLKKTGPSRRQAAVPTGSRSSAVPAGSRSSAVSSAPPGERASPASKSDTAGEQTGRGAGGRDTRGRPEASIEELAANHMGRFAGPEAVQIYFGDIAVAQCRSISRYIAQATSKLLNLKGDREVSMTLARKRLQVIESSSKMHQAWLARKQNRGAPVRVFLHEWNNLLVFCSSEPKVDYKCEYMQDLYLQVLCADPMHLNKAKLCEGLRLSKLGGDEAVKAQATYFRQGVSCILQFDGTTAQAATSLAELLQLVCSPDFRDDFDTELLCQVQELRVILAPSMVATKGEAVNQKQYQDLVKSLNDLQAEDDIKEENAALIDLLLVYPRHGKAIIVVAQGVQHEYTEQCGEPVMASDGQ